MTRSIRWWRGLIAGAAVTSVFGASAASATTPPAEPLETTPVASSLTNPRGFTWDDDGQLVVAMAGSGGESPPTEDTPTNAIIGPFAGGTTGAVASIDDSGCPAALVTGLPSTLTATGEVLGAEDVAYLDGELYIGVDGGGAGHGNADNPSGIYRMADDGSAELVADLSAWMRENPVAAIPGDSDPDAGGYSIVVEPDSGTLWVDDPNSGQILSVAVTDGSISRVADLSDPHIVPTRLALDPAGGVFVGTSDDRAVPRRRRPGDARRHRRHCRGRVDRADDGRRCRRRCRRHAVRPGAVDRQPHRAAVPHTRGAGGSCARPARTPSEAVHEGLMFPIAMEIGPDGAFYVSTPAIGANDGSGAIVRLAAGAPDRTARPDGERPAGGRGSRVRTRSRAPPARCHHPHRQPPRPGSAPARRRRRRPPRLRPSAPAAPASAPAGSAPAAESTVTIKDFAFGPAERQRCRRHDRDVRQQRHDGAHGNGRRRFLGRRRDRPR